MLCFIGFPARKKFEYVKANDTLVRKVQHNKAKIINIAIKTNRPEILENLFSLYKRKARLDEIDDYIAACKDASSVTAFLRDYKARNYLPEEVEKHENDKTEKKSGLKKLTLEEWRLKFEFRFQNHNQTVSIKSYKGREQSLIIPEEINNYKVDYIQSLSCPEIKYVHIPDSITNISDSCFDGCIGLADENGFVVFRNKLYNYFGTATDITVPNGVTQIGNRAFQGCSDVKTINIPESVTAISGRAFRDCKNLETINFTKAQSEDEE